MNGSYGERLRLARAAYAEAEYVLVGAGAGLSAAAGLAYSGPRFQNNFADFIEKYGLKDMYTAAFYPFATQREKWAYWSRHILLNRYDAPVGGVYRLLRELVRGKDYFVLTTNVDGQFFRAGFPAERVFAVQGDYGKLQCALACHDTLYEREAGFREMKAEQRGCAVPEELVPKCPVCGGEMEVNIRKDANFVEDADWYGANRRYASFLQRAEGKPLLLLELGVGFNTPGIIRYPFERMCLTQPHTRLLRVNRDEPEALPENNSAICFSEDTESVLRALTEERL